MVHFNWFLKKTIAVLGQERDGMHWQKNWPTSRQENGFFEVWPVGLIFFLFHQYGSCTCFYKEKTKIIARATRANHKRAASLKI